MVNFEVHITVPLAHADTAKAVAAELHWKTSEIARDPVLGNDTYFYLTTHGAELLAVQTRMDNAVLTLRYMGVPVLREKIEVVIHDVRSPL